MCSGEEAVPAKKTKTVISTSEISQTRQTRVEKVQNTSEAVSCQMEFRLDLILIMSSSLLSMYFLIIIISQSNLVTSSVSVVCPQRMEASFQATAMMEMHVEGGELTQQLAHKTPPRVPPKPTSKSPTQLSLVAKVTGGRQQSPSPVRHVKAPTPTPVRWVEPLVVMLGVNGDICSILSAAFLEKI